MDQRELDAMLASLAAELRGLGIPVSPKLLPGVQVNTRAKRRLGCCIYREGVYRIEVAAALLDDPPMLRETLDRKSVV